MSDSGVYSTSRSVSKRLSWLIRVNVLYFAEWTSLQGSSLTSVSRFMLQSMDQRPMEAFQTPISNLRFRKKEDPPKVHQPSSKLPNLRLRGGISPGTRVGTLLDVTSFHVSNQISRPFRTKSLHTLPGSSHVQNLPKSRALRAWSLYCHPHL